MDLQFQTCFWGADHGGFALKQDLRPRVQDWLETATPKSEFQHTDCGAFSDESADYPDVARLVVKGILNADNSESPEAKTCGILMCGTGLGVSMAANRFPGIRAALCHTPDYARLAREHNNANILVLGGRFIQAPAALAIVQTFITTPFQGGRHQRRIEKIENVSF